MGDGSGGRRGEEGFKGREGGGGGQQWRLGDGRKTKGLNGEQDDRKVYSGHLEGIEILSDVMAIVIPLSQQCGDRNKAFQRSEQDFIIGRIEPAAGWYPPMTERWSDKSMRAGVGRR
ncbi:hypothetical protein ABZP36_009358 [Zizania latifolia]